MDGTDTPTEGIIRSRGIKFPRRPALMPPRVRQALKGHRYEWKEAEAVLKTVRPDDVVMELGGGIGFISSLIATHRAVDHVHVFEANSVLADYIRETHALNEITNTTVHHAILGRRKGKADFYVRKQFVASSLDAKDGADVIRTESVDVMNVKTAMKEIKPTFLVCDIEGAEVDLIPLMDLSTVRAAVIELHPQWIGADGVNAVFRAFMDAGLAYAAKQSNQKVVTFRRGWAIR